MLDKELKYYVENQNELVKKYNGRVIVIKDEHVIGVYDDETQAYFDAEKHNEPGTFLIQKVEPGEPLYTATFHSRVYF